MLQKCNPTLRRMDLYSAYQHRNREMCWLTQLGRGNYSVRYRTFVEPRRSCSIEEFRRLEAWNSLSPEYRLGTESKDCQLMRPKSLGSK